MKATKIGGESKDDRLVSVPFHGDTLDAIRDDAGKVWVSLRRCCANLGLDLETQRRKLRGKAWAVTGEMPATGPDSKTYMTTMIDLETLPGWLFSIDARKVAGSVREKLAHYQREAARVLAEHFIYGTAAGVSQHAYDALMAKLASWTAWDGPDPDHARATLTECMAAESWAHARPATREQVRKLAEIWCEVLLRSAPKGTAREPVYSGKQIAVAGHAIQWVARQCEMRREQILEAVGRIAIGG